MSYNLETQLGLVLVALGMLVLVLALIWSDGKTRVFSLEAAVINKDPRKRRLYRVWTFLFICLCLLGLLNEQIVDLFRRIT